MGLVDWVTLGLALVGSALGIFNTVTNFHRGRVVWKVVGEVQVAPDGTLSLRVDVVNTGRIPVTVEEVFLATARGKQARSRKLTDARGWPRMPCELAPGKKVTISPVHNWALKEVVVDQPITIVAQSQDGRSVKTSCPRLREIYNQLQAAESEGAAKAV